MQNMMSNQTTDPTTKHGMLSGVNMKLRLFTKKNRSRGPPSPSLHDATSHWLHGNFIPNIGHPS
jgi:hypothetical protein